MKNLTNPTIIVGGGFVGLFTALHLSHRHYRNPIILIDPQDRFVFKPLLYEYLTGEMQEEEVFPRYEELLQGSDVAFVRDTVTAIDLQQSRLELASGLHYHCRYLVMGVGSTQGYFDTKGAKEHAFPFRTREDALRLEKHLRGCWQRASQTQDRQTRQRLLTVAVVGAGPSGVEMAATLADLLPEWYAKLGGDFENIRLVLVNHGREILTGDINSHLQETALNALNNRTLPIELLLGVKVTAVGSDGLEYRAKDREETEVLATETTIWTAGTATNPLIEHLSIPAENRDKHGLPLVTPTLQLPDFPEVFAAGDCAVVRDRSLPPVAQVAYQQGAAIADNLLALSRGEKPHPVEINLRGTLMKLGLNNGVANIFNQLHVNEKTGDLIRKATYLELLPTPVHNFKATTEWLTDEIFHRYHQPQRVTVTSARSRAKSPVAIWISTALAIALIIGSIAVWRTTRTSQPQPQIRREQLDR